MAKETRQQRRRQERETAEEIRAHAAARAKWPDVTVEIDDDGGRFYFDKAEADRYCEFFPTFLVHFDGEFGPSPEYPDGQPFFLFDWQALLIVRPLFGWKYSAKGCGCKACGGDPEGLTYGNPCRKGMRRFRNLFLFIPKKNGKTVLVAGLGLAITHLDGENEPGAQVLVAAAEKDQARYLFDYAWNMTEKNHHLRDRSVLRAVGPRIFIPSTRAIFRAISAESKGKHGPNLHAILFDELHEQPDDRLYNTLTKGVAARRQPITIFITTAGTDVTSICYKEYEHAKAVVKGVSEDENYLPVIFEADPKEDWTKPSTWRKANPSYGITVKPDYLAREVTLAQEDSSKQASLRQLHLNIWSQAASAWMPVDRWEACRVPPPLVIPAGCQVVAGFDLASTLDLTALAIIVRRPIDDDPKAPVLELKHLDEQGRAYVRRILMNFNLDLHVWFWIPEAPMAQHEREDRIEYGDWVRKGFVRATPGDMTDYGIIFEQLTSEILPAFEAAGSPVQEIGFDPANAGMFISALQSTGLPVIEVKQTVVDMSDPAKVLKALVMSKRLRHDGNPCLRWNAANAVAREDAKENIFVKKPQERKRIDGVIAGIIALNRLMGMGPPARGAYDNRKPIMVG